MTARTNSPVAGGKLVRFFFTVLSVKSIQGILGVATGRLARNDNFREFDMKTIILVAALSLVSTGAFAQATCKSRAAEQKLAGAALNSFMKKCETEANTACEADSSKRKLAGAAKTSHMKKCVTDAVGG